MDHERVTTEPADGVLVEKARRGDADAYGDLVRRYQALAIRTAYLVGGTDVDSEDAAQEGFIKAYAALGRFHEGAPFRPWLLRIVANEAINRRRARARRPTVTLEAVAGRASDVVSPEEALLASSDRDRHLAAMGRLRDEDRTVIAYRYFLDLPEADIAVALDCARGTVKSRLSRALGRLREAIDG